MRFARVFRYLLLTFLLLCAGPALAQGTGSGNGNSATNLSLSITNNSGVISIALSGLQTGTNYEILTNCNPASSTWRVWQTLLATNSVVLIPLLPVGNTAQFFWAQSFTPPVFPGGYISNGLVACWQLNDGSGSVATDCSGNGNNLPLIGDPAWGAGDLNFDGDEQYGDAGSNTLDVLDKSDKTICAWVNPGGVNAQGSTYQAIVDKSYYDGGSDFGGWQFYLTNNQVGLLIMTDTLRDEDDTIAPPGQWTFLAVVWHTHTDTAEFYVNGPGFRDHGRRHRRTAQWPGGFGSGQRAGQFRRRPLLLCRVAPRRGDLQSRAQRG